MLGKIPAARLALIEKIVKSAPRQLPARSRTLARDFLRAFFRGVAEEDLRAHRPRDLAKAALAHLEFGRQRSGSRVLVELASPLNPSSGVKVTVPLAFNTAVPPDPLVTEAMNKAALELSTSVSLPSNCAAV